MRDKIIKNIASLYFLGYTSKFPGTLASLLGVLVIIITGSHSLSYFLILGISLICGFWVSGKAERILNIEDPKEVVIDEFCGMLLSFFLIELSAFYIIAGFIFFRAFDILKPYPIREAEKMKGSRGIMLDDLLSGLFTNLVLRVLQIMNF